MTKNSDSKGSAEPANDHDRYADNLAGINETIKSIERSNEAYKNENLNRDWWRFRIEIIVAGGVILYTLLTAGLFFSAISQLKAAWSQVSDGHKQIINALQSEQRQLRAYVGVEDHKLSGVATSQKPHWEVVIKNFGQTPATNVSYWVSSIVDAAQTPTKLAMSPFHGDGVLFPGDRITVVNDVTNPLTPSDMAGLSNNDATMFYVYGQVKYLDAFGEHRCTKFRLVFGGEISVRLNPQRLAVATEGNEIDKNCPK